MQFTIIKSSTVPSGRLERVGKMDVWIVYNVTGAGANSVVIPAEDFDDDAKITAAVEANEATHGGKQGRQFGAP
jgi:hypothetical protein